MTIKLNNCFFWGGGGRGTSLESSSTVLLTLTMALAKDVLEALRSKPN